MIGKKEKIIVITGPTASGKTRLSLDIAEKFNGEILSADSMQIYKEFDISTAKPSRYEMQRVKHHLINIRSVNEEFSVADFVKEAKKAVNYIINSNKVPMFVGGTGLYIDSFLKNIEFNEQKVSNSLRESLWEEVRCRGPWNLIKELEIVDKESLATIHPNNLKRLIRAVEFYRTTGMPISKQVEMSLKTDSPYDAVAIGLNFKDRSKLYGLINKRVDIMIENGLVDEILSIYQNGIGKTASEAIGYKEMIPYLKGLCTLNEAVEKIKLGTRRYAKRQITWFKRNKAIKWFYVDNYDDYNGLLKDVVNYLKKELTLDGNKEEVERT